MATNIPLIKIKGNLIMVANIIILAGLSVGGADIKVPKEEKQKAAIIVPKINEKFIISAPNNMQLTNKTKEVIKRPNKTEAITSPKMIAHKVIGEDTNLSKVLILVSQGAITGLMAETVKKSTIPSKLGIKDLKGNSLFRKKATNKKAGNNKLWITTGPLK